MADSDEEGAAKDDAGLDLTSFLFGNIGSSGQLEEEFLDESTKKQLTSLGSLLADTNLNSIVREVSIEAGDKDDTANGTADEDINFDEKAPDAEDFSNIDEMMDDDSSSSDDSDNDNDDEEAAKEEVSKEEEKPAPVEEASEMPEKVDSDSLLMPPPPAGGQGSRPAAPAPGSAPSPGVGPLAGMLPEKYKDVDVKSFFPEFKENSVLRFSKLFPIKESHKPRTWKALKKRRRKELGQDADDSESKE